MKKIIILLMASVLTTQVYANDNGFFQSYHMLCANHYLKQFDEIQYCRSDIMWAKKDGKYGFVNKKGEVVVPLIYDQASWFYFNWFSDDVGFVKQGLTWIAFDKDGNQLYSIVADEVMAGFGEHAKFIKHTEQGTKAGLIETYTGKTVIPVKYDGLSEVHDGAIGFVQNNKYGFLDLNGKVIVQPIYDGVGIFIKGKAVVYKDGKSAVIDKKGEVIVPFTSQKIFINKDGEVSYQDWWVFVWIIKIRQNNKDNIILSLVDCIGELLPTIIKSLTVIKKTQ